MILLGIPCPFREQPGETQDLDTDPTLPRSSISCPHCAHDEAVFYQDQSKRFEVRPFGAPTRARPALALATALLTSPRPLLPASPQTRMTLFYVCTNCKNLFEDPGLKNRRA